MSAPRTWTTADDATLRTLHAAGKSCHAIAIEMSRSKASISRESKRLGLPWDRSQVSAATAAKQTDAKSRRATLQLRLLEDAEKLRQQLWQPCIAFNFGGKDNTYEEHNLDKPTFADQLKIMQATGVAVDRSLKLADHDSGAGAQAVIGLLQQTAAALGIHDELDTAST